MDLPSLNALLRVNGLSAESTPEQISAILRDAGYRDAEIKDALAVLHGAAPPSSADPHPQPTAYITAILERTSVTGTYREDATMFGSRIGPRQFWIASAMALALFCLFFLAVEVIILPLFTIASGISFLSLPDLTLAPVTTVVLVGVGVMLFVLPFISFAVLAAGLQVRRFHDLGFSATAWLGVVVAIAVLALVSLHYPVLHGFGPLIVALIYAAVLSIPGSSEENMYGGPIAYQSVWASLLGSTREESCTRELAREFLLPVVYVQILGLVAAFGIHTLLPRVSMPQVNAPDINPPTSALREDNDTAK
jgi:uncharacterized membrane protein YhaH (DUF805 family)